MNVFELRNKVIEEYADYIRSFIVVDDKIIERKVESELKNGLLWPEPLVQLNPSFEPGESLESLTERGILHPECLKIFCDKPEVSSPFGTPFHLHKHQVEAILAANNKDNYVLTTGTGSGKSLSYIVPIVDHVLRNGSGKGIQAIIVYPMNALANSQLGELTKFLCHGYPGAKGPVTFRRYTGQEKDDERNDIIANPPDILLTNYVMLELVLTRPRERRLVQAAKGLRFLVFDELHTYRGRQGADVAMLVRRVRDACEGTNLIHVGTSATLAGGGSWEEQQGIVAKTAGQIFGAPVKPSCVIGETLRRATPYVELDDPTFAARLKEEIARGGSIPPETHASFMASPLSSWIESVLGLSKDSRSGRLIRCTPQPISGENGAAAKLSRTTGIDQDKCEREIRRHLLAGYDYRDHLGRPVFAFRLHQFLSKGEAVYASLEAETDRHITLQSQKFVPGSDRSKRLYPLVFCRECGQEYYVVRRILNENKGASYIGRELSDQIAEGGEPGFLHIDTEDPWPIAAESIEHLPDSWIEEVGGLRKVKKSRRDRLPREVFLEPSGVEGKGSLRAHFLQTPFSFCLKCKVAYSAHQKSDFGKLATLGSEGRSTATTVLSLANIRRLRKDQDLEKKARKLLSFTDNRQDASLQAGHFNDFVEIALLRSALFKAVKQAGAEGLRHDVLPLRVFDALDLPLEMYATNPEVEYLQLDQTRRALRNVLGYHLYLDLRRGWRITSPNLEQCGLLDIQYVSLEQLCRDEQKWHNTHPALVSATPAEREQVCKVLLDFMRRELAIRVNYLNAADQESIQLQSSQYLISPWALDEYNPMETHRVVFPSSGSSERSNVYISPRGGFGLLLKRPDTFQHLHGQQLKTEDVSDILGDLFKMLQIAGLVQQVVEPKDGGTPGYQLNASGMIWKAGDGVQAFHDPIRVPGKPEKGLRTNPFFVGFYQMDTADIRGVEAREHTAQVSGELREQRERDFKEGKLPILYCSPTMELGVDISQLNVVNMRNVPPTPANYAQRSGRAGRSGQPAFVYAYCTAGSPHDQYFFKRPELMVAGMVSTPRLDLANKDLLKAHVHAIWLAESGLDLQSSLAEILDVEGDSPSFALLPNVRAALEDVHARRRANVSAQASLRQAVAELVGTDRVNEWIADVLNQVPQSFERACDRWRSLYQAALEQQKRQSRIARDASRTQQDRDKAKRLRGEAESQLNLLLERDVQKLSDFYSYRYFASEGFLPGYNFPRLPLSAYLPGRRSGQQQDDFLSRPRFLAISEFGPRAFIYHEGSRYVINKVILPVDVSLDGSITRSAAQCRECGYIHPVFDDPSPDLCERCQAVLPAPMPNLFRMENVATRRRDRINSDEEERFRLGYEIVTGVRFEHREGAPTEQTATLEDKNGEPLAKLTYGHAATLWRLNLGWRRRKEEEQLGYVLDVERGYWAKSQATEDDPADELSARTKRVIPYVEDRRNCLLIEPASSLELSEMATLQAALKTAIQTHFQLEDNELAAEPMPDAHDRRFFLLFESSEGGAGVLKHLVEDADVLPDIAGRALEIAHYDKDTLEDKRRASGSTEDCEAACYNCLLSYYNQRDHDFIDRKLLPPILTSWAEGRVAVSRGAVNRDDHLMGLLRLCDSDLEKKWLTLLQSKKRRLPSDAQFHIPSCNARPDFFYKSENLAVFVDGPAHDDPAQIQKDRAIQDTMEQQGYMVLRFRYDEDWELKLAEYADVFGAPSESRPPSPSLATAQNVLPSSPPLDMDLFDPKWHAFIEKLTANDKVTVDAGSDVSEQGRVVGQYFALVQRDASSVYLVDANDPNAESLTRVLTKQGFTVAAVSADAPGDVNSVLSKLKG